MITRYQADDYHAVAQFETQRASVPFSLSRRIASSEAAKTQPLPIATHFVRLDKG